MNQMRKIFDKVFYIPFIIGVIKIIKKRMMQKDTIIPIIHSIFSRTDIGFNISVRPHETESHILS